MPLQMLTNPAVAKLAPNMGAWPIYGYGNSYLALSGSHFTAGHHYLQIAASRLGAGTVTSYGVGGSRSLDTWAHAGSAGTWPGSGKGPATGAQWPGTSSRSGLVVVDLAVNDIGHYASGSTPAAITSANTQYLDSMKATRRAILALLSSETRVEATAYSGTSGTWSTLAGAPYSGDSVEFTTVAGAYREYSITPAQTGPLAGKVWLATLTQATASGVLAPITVAVDGVSQGTTTLSPWESYTDTGTVNTGVGCIPITIPVDNAAHTVRITHAGSAGQPMYPDAFLIPSSDPNPIMVMGSELAPNVGLWNASQVGIYRANAALLKPVIQAVVAEFANATYVPSTMTSGGLYSGDGIHPNDRGMQQRANDLVYAVQGLRPRLENRALAAQPDSVFATV